MTLSEIFNTREIAYILLGALFFIFTCFHKGIQKDIKPILAALFTKHILIIYLLTIVYTTFCVMLLVKIGMWDFSLLKDTIVWMIFAALPTMYKACTASNVKMYFKTTLFELIQVTIFLEFILGLHTFVLWIELLIGAFLLLLQGLIVFSHKPEQVKVHKIFKSINKLIFIFMLFAVGIHLYDHFLQYWTFAYFEQFALSLEFTLMLIPFLYLLVVYMRFEEIFLTINSRMKHPDLLMHTKWILLLNFFFNLKGIKRWEQQFLMRRPETRQDVLKSIKDVKELQKAEENPPAVLADSGWSPYISKNYMKEHSLPTGQYVNHYDNSWSATSAPLRLSDDYFANDLVYEVTGNKTIVTQLEMILKVFDLSKKGNGHEVFANYFTLLFDKIFPGDSVPAGLANAIIKGKKCQMLYKNYQLICQFDQYNNRFNTYNLKVAIQHPNHSV
ncbi:hypothetical protein [Pedobacter sp. WC2423]|uniref:hypothetical protein n=1 Tax=Pedobacter sp. WC2423 TaxID=3234142 RepID=UPI0034676C14